LCFSSVPAGKCGYSAIVWSWPLASLSFNIISPFEAIQSEIQTASENELQHDTEHSV
jgi:hypothetical protein